MPMLSVFFIKVLKHPFAYLYKLVGRSIVFKHVSSLANDMYVLFGVSLRRVNAVDCGARGAASTLTGITV